MISRISRRIRQLFSSPARLVHIPDSDRGPTPFFHGRLQELEAFKRSLTDAKRSNGGTILIVQGPPGAGKTALLHECAEQAIAQKWRVADLTIDALHDPSELAKKLQQAYVTMTTSQSETGVEEGLSLFIGRSRSKRTSSRSCARVKA